jgi:hypothetical protein
MIKNVPMISNLFGKMMELALFAPNINTAAWRMFVK